MTLSSGRPLVIGLAGSERPRPVELTSKLINENFIQALLDEHPDLIPVDELPLVSGPLLSLGRELPVSLGVGPNARRGLVDNLFISASGEIVVAEAKLWSNPEARRMVVAQVLDYAAALSRLDYTSFDDLVSANLSTGSLWEAVSTAFEIPEVDERHFIDSVARRLASGRFELVIVGNGIREDVQHLASTLSDSPGLAFHLALVELRVFELASGDRLVIPSVVAQSREVSRAVVEVRNDATGAVVVSVETLAAAEPDRAATLSSIEDLEQQILLNAPNSAAPIIELARWWSTVDGAWCKFNARSAILMLEDHGPKPGTSARVGLLWDNGDVGYPSLSLARRVGLASEAELDARARRHGFVGNKSLRRPDFSLRPEDLGDVRSLLEWTVEELRTLRSHRDSRAEPEGPHD